MFVVAHRLVPAEGMMQAFTLLCLNEQLMEARTTTKAGEVRVHQPASGCKDLHGDRRSLPMRGGVSGGVRDPNHGLAVDLVFHDATDRSLPAFPDFMVRDVVAAVGAR